VRGHDYRDVGGRVMQEAVTENVKIGQRSNLITSESFSYKSLRHFVSRNDDLIRVNRPGFTGDSFV